MDANVCIGISGTLYRRKRVAEKGFFNGRAQRAAVLEEDSVDSNINRNRNRERPSLNQKVVAASRFPARTSAASLP